MPTSRNYPRAAILALIAFGVWTISDALLKHIRAAGVPQGEIFIMSGLSGIGTLFLVAALRGQVRRLQPHRWTSLAAIGLCQLVAFIFWMIAIPHLPLANMYVVTFLTPMVVACMAALFLKEPLGWKRALAIIGGFVGVVVAVNPVGIFTGQNAWYPYLAVFCNMAASSTQLFLLRVVADKESSECTAFYPRMVLILAGLISCVATGFTALSPEIFLLLCVQGASGGIGWALMAQAYKNAPAAAVAPFQYSQMLGGALLGYLFWSDIPDTHLLAGAAIIIASGFFLIRHERRVSRLMIRPE